MDNNMLAELDERLGELKKTLAIMAKYAPAPGVLCAPTMEMGLGWKAKSLLPSIEAAHATLADMAKRLEAAERELSHARAVRDRLVQHLTSIHALLYPAPIDVDGQVRVFRPRLIDPHELMQELSDRIRAIPAAIDATQEGEG